MSRRLLDNSHNVQMLCRFFRILFLLGVLVMLGCSSAQQTIVISEAVSSNSASFTDEILGSPDWIELHNVSSGPIDLQGYILTDKEDKYSLDNMLHDMTIPAGGYIVIPADADHAGDSFCLPFSLSKNGDTVCLISPDGRLMEKIVLPALPRDVSYARREDGTFGYCILPTPGERNGGEISDVCPEPAAADAELPQAEEPEEKPQSPVHLYLNEIVSNDDPNGACGGKDWIELYNPNDTEVSLSGLFLSDREQNPQKAPLPATAIPPKSYILIPCDDADDAVPIRISSEGETVYLFDLQEQLVDSVAVPALYRGQSWSRNRNGIFGYCGNPTPAAENNDIEIGIEQLVPADGSESLRISEVLFRNTYSIIDAYGDHSDYLELYNAGTESVPLAEYWLSDDFTNPMKWHFPDSVLEPGEYLLVFLSGQESVSGELHAPFSVSSSDDGIQLYHFITRKVQRIPWSDEIPKNTSAGLERNGTIVYFKYPTPGGPNSVAITDLHDLSAFPADHIHFSEVSAGGAEGEWIELQNGAGDPVHLEGWYICDSSEADRRFSLKGTAQPGSFFSFEPDAFRIRASGETLYLIDGNNHVRDVFSTGDLTGGITSGRTDDPAVSRVFFLKATRNAPNDSASVPGRVSAPIIPDLSLYRTDPFSVSIQCADPDAVIHYTLDGSEPTENSPIYREPILISSSLTLRAVSMKTGFLSSAISNANYLFASPHTLPVVCISCTPSDFKAFTRITVQGRYPHTDANIAFYDEYGTIGTMFPAEINPRGNQSIKYPQKSLSIHLRTRLGQPSVNYPFWGNGTALDYETLILRNGSQDHAKARLRDSFALCAVSDLDLDSARTRPVIVYVNGEYYGIMDFNEGMNQDYLVTHYQVDHEEIDHISTNDTVRYGSNTDFLRVRKFARQWKLEDPSAYEEFSKWVDTEYIIDYVIAQTFFGNYDVKNQSYWATHDYRIRWRPVFYDIDRCFTDNASRYNLFDQYFNKRGVVYDKTAGRIVNMDIYAALRENPEWCDRFLHRYAQLLVTDFSVENLQALLDKLAAGLRPEMAQHIAKFHTPRTMAEWEASINSMRKEIAVRYQVIQTQICKEFGLSKAQWEAMLAEAAE